MFNVAHVIDFSSEFELIKINEIRFYASCLNFNFDYWNIWNGVVFGGGYKGDEI